MELIYRAATDTDGGMLLFVHSPGGATGLGTKACGLLSYGPLLYELRLQEIEDRLKAAPNCSLDVVLRSNVFSQPQPTKCDAICTCIKPYVLFVIIYNQLTTWTKII